MFACVRVTEVSRMTDWSSEARPKTGFIVTNFQTRQRIDDRSQRGFSAIQLLVLVNSIGSFVKYRLGCKRIVILIFEELVWGEQGRGIRV